LKGLIMNASSEAQRIPSVKEMELAYKNSDSSYDGIFYLAVKSTGIFCRPSCSARKPLPKNVEYYQSAREAVFAGYRPCKRCHPLEASGTPPEWVSSLLKIIEENPTARYNDAFLRSIKIDPARARRYFLKNYNMTFQAYCRGRRLGISFEQIKNGKNLDDVALGHGYESHSGFRDAFVKTFGTSPGRSKEADYIVSAWIDSPMGPLIAAATEKGVCLLEFSDRRMLDAQFTILRKIFKCPIVPGNNKYIDQLKKELKDYFDGKLKQFTVQIVYPGSEFQQKVWKELLTIKYGKTLSYEEMAKKVGVPKGQRAVGHANGLNRIALVIPCHRVVNKNGNLGGYGGGLWRKEKLLRLEKENNNKK
jgi:AraC family transcriptional regulator, regulatory protein of adaptative response / methylated-DNA-[protein]-cysteine methyltransferase